LIFNLPPFFSRLTITILLLLSLLLPAPVAASAVPFDLRGLLESMARSGELSEVSAESFVVMDKQTGRILASRNPDQRRFPASITKLMTALIIAERQSDLSVVVTVSEKAASQEPSKMFLQTGEQITVYDLLQGILISSANDGAVALSEWAAGSVEGFVELMNQKARALELSNTYFRNPIGFDYIGHYSSASDLSALAYYAVRNPVIREIVAREQAVVFSTDGQIRHTLRTTNQLLSEPHIQGLKTGFTPLAGESLTLYATQNGKELIIVILGSEDRFQDGRRLTDWGLRQLEESNCRFLCRVQPKEPPTPLRSFSKYLHQQFWAKNRPEDSPPLVW